MCCLVTHIWLLDTGLHSNLFDVIGKNWYKTKTLTSKSSMYNAAARLVFSEPKRAHVTPLFVSLHWLPVAARIQFKTLMLAYRTATGSAPAYFHSVITIYIPSRSLRSVSDASWCHHREAQNHVPERFHSPFLAGGMNFPPPSGMLSPWRFSSDTWKLISSIFTWLLLLLLHKKTHTKMSLCSLFLTSHCLASCSCSEQCLKCCITSTSCECLPLYNYIAYCIPQL